MFVDSKFTQFSVDFSVRACFFDGFQWTVTFFTVEEKSFVSFSFTVIDMIGYRCHSVVNVCTHCLCLDCIRTIVQSTLPHLNIFNDEIFQLLSWFILLLTLRNDVYVSWNYCFLRSSLSFFLSLFEFSRPEIRANEGKNLACSWDLFVYFT